MKKASELQYGEKLKISEIDFTHPSSQRILEIGFTPGQEIELIIRPLFNDPLAFSVRGSLIAIRKDEADCIKVA
ncbi:MAG TPA: FeoA family protein [Ignavibacteriaceae bacterium]|jgi:ferrous iron transport protein A